MRSFIPLPRQSHYEQARMPHDLRRNTAALALLTPRPPFAAALLADLHARATDLEAAIEHTRRCEAERRSLLCEKRVAARLFAQACDLPSA